MTIDPATRLTYAIARARHSARHRRARGHPIVVFSMAKTGSSAVAAGLRTAGLGDVYHVHDLDPIFLAQEESEYRWSGRPWRIWDAQRLLQRPPSATVPWHVVSIVREPIAQTVSAFFQPGVRRGYVDAGATVEPLLDRFGDRLDRLPLRWFETHVQPSLGIDVYSVDFDREARYQIISTATIRLLLLRCEDLAVAPAALAELLDVDGAIDVPRVNVGAQKDYAATYASFTAALRPSAAQLDRAYGSRVVQHFYSSDEIDRFRAVWRSGGAPAPGPARIEG